MKERNELEQIDELMHLWFYKIRSSNFRGQVDINKFSENLAAKLLNIIYDLELVNQNFINRNQVAIDLVDDKRGIAYQITSVITNQKIKDTLKDYIKPENNIIMKYPLLNFFILNFEYPKYRQEYNKLYNQFKPENIITDKIIIRECEKIYNSNDKTVKNKFFQIKELLVNAFKDPKYEINFKDLTPNSSFPSPRKFINVDNWKLFSFIGKQNTPVVLTGIDGIGKTTTLQSYYEAYKSTYDYSARINFDKNLQNSFINYARMDLIQTLNLPDIVSNDFEATFNLIREKFKQLSGNKLLIIDNVNKNLTNIELDFLKILTRSHNWHVLLSSQSKINDLIAYPIESHSYESALQIWQLYYEKEIKDDEVIIIKEVLSIIGHHPLLVELLAKTANNSMLLNLSQLKDTLRRKGLGDFKTTIQPLSIEIETNLSDYISAVFDISYLTDIQKTLLFQFSIFLVEPMSFEDIIFVLQIKINELQNFENEINKLIKYGWLNKFENKILMHPICREIVFHLLQIKINSIEIILDTFSNKITSLARDKGNSYIFEFVKYIPIIESISNLKLLINIELLSDYLIPIINNLAMLYHSIGNSSRACQHYLELLPILETLSNEIESNIIYKSGIYSSLASMQRHLTEYNKAEVNINKAENLLFKLDNYFVEKATILNNKSLILNGQKKYQAAYTAQFKAIELREKNLPSNHSDLGNSYDNMSRILLGMSRYKEALQYQNKAISIRKIIIPDKPDLAFSYNHLSEIYEILHDYILALEFEMESFNILKKLFPKEHSFMQNSISNIVRLKHKMA